MGFAASRLRGFAASRLRGFAASRLREEYTRERPRRLSRLNVLALSRHGLPGRIAPRPKRCSKVPSQLPPHPSTEPANGTRASPMNHLFLVSYSKTTIKRWITSVNQYGRGPERSRCFPPGRGRGDAAGVGAARPARLPWGHAGPRRGARRAPRDGLLGDAHDRRAAGLRVATGRGRVPKPQPGRLDGAPASTFHYILPSLPPAALDRALRCVGAPLRRRTARTCAAPQGGRGTGASLLVAAVQLGSGLVLGAAQVGDKTNEAPAVRELAPRWTGGRTVTLDTQHAQ